MKSNFIKSFAVVFSAIVILTASACKKEGPGGKSSVSGNVKHHTKLIPNAVVYIKYGATEFPGSDVSVYDASVTSDTNAHYEFKDLQKGDYYLYGVGVDQSGGVTNSFPVTGGVGVKLSKNKASTADIPVTE
jgi:hypothetical protein